MKGRKPVDFWILYAVLILLAIGTIMVFSSSYYYAQYYIKSDPYYFFRKQLFMLTLGLVAMFFAMNFDYRKLGKLSPIVLVGTMCLLILVLVPHIGINRNGATRWIGIAGQEFQPSEILKYAVILFYSFSLSKRQEKIKNFFNGLLPYLILLGIIAVLLVLEPHNSATIIIALVVAVLLFCAGAKISHFLMMGIPGIVGLGTVIFLSPHGRKRIESFLNPLADPLGAGFQSIQSLYAIGSGGLFGRGLGRSMQKLLFIPEPYNDFILSVLAEELGFLGVFTVMLLFLILIWRGIKVAMSAPDMFGTLVAVGITTLIGVQLLINVAVVSATIPVTGVPLPFFSYGGTSLVFLMAGVGVLLNISRYAKYDRI